MKSSYIKPYPVSKSVLNAISIHSSHFKNPKKLQQQLIELYLCIYNKYSISEYNTTEYHKIKDSFVFIHRDSFLCFKLVMNKKLYQYNDLIKMLVKLNLIEVKGTIFSTETYRAKPKVSKDITPEMVSNVSSYSKAYRIISPDATVYKNVDVDLSHIFQCDPLSVRDLIRKDSSLAPFKTIIKSTFNIKLDMVSLLKNPNATGLNLFRTVKYAYGYHWFSESSSGRFYNDLALLNSDFIQYCKINDKETISLDAKNCQPTLYCNVIESAGYTTEYIGYRKYKDAVESGVFYESLFLNDDGTFKNLDILNHHISISNKTPNKKFIQLLSDHSEKSEVRDIVKTFCYKHIFFGNSKINSFNARVLDSFPGVVDIINELKTNGIINSRDLRKTFKNSNRSIKELIKETNTAFNYNWFTLQKLESDIFVTIAKESPYVCGIRHDQLIFENDPIQIEYFTNKINESFKKLNLKISLSNK